MEIRLITNAIIPAIRNSAVPSILSETSRRIATKKNADSKHSSVTVTDSLTQFAKQLGALGPVNVIMMSVECL